MYEKRRTYIIHVYQIQITYNFPILRFKHNTCIYDTCLSLKPSLSSRDKLNRLTTFFFGSCVYIKGSYCSLSKATCIGCKFAQQQKFVLLLSFFGFGACSCQSLSYTIREKQRIRGGLKLLTFDVASVKRIHILRIEMNE